VRELMSEHGSWAGCASDLLRFGANRSRNDAVGCGPDWPKSPRALAGRLRRAQTFLRAMGIEIAFSREGHAGSRVIKMHTRFESSVSTVSSVHSNGSTRHESPMKAPHKGNRVANCDEVELMSMGEGIVAGAIATASPVGGPGTLLQRGKSPSARPPGRGFHVQFHKCRALLGMPHIGGLPRLQLGPGLAPPPGAFSGIWRSADVRRSVRAIVNDAAGLGKSCRH
jgi:hypothetical protein